MRLWKALYAVYFSDVKTYGRGLKTAYRQNEILFDFKNADFCGKMAYFIPKKLKKLFCIKFVLKMINERQEDAQRFIFFISRWSRRIRLHPIGIIYD